LSGAFPGGSAAAQVAVVIVSFNTRDDLLRCLGSLDVVKVPLEVVVVDNASADGSAEAVRRGFPRAQVLENAANEGYARANNRGFRSTRAPFVLLLNSDAEVRAGTVETLLEILTTRPAVGIVGPRTVGSDGALQVSSGPDLTPLQEWKQRRLVHGVEARDRGALAFAAGRYSAEHEPTWVSGSCLLTRRAHLDSVGGLDEGFFLYEEDVDLCVRVRRLGYKILFTPAAEVLHHRGRSMAREPGRARFEYHRSHLRYYRKHRSPGQVALLRTYLGVLGIHAAATGVVGAGATGPGPDRWALIRLALRGA
jgi:N-acetylglucosaminyl-diphospho-decaprenol L-rhamnosyltransferase